MRFDSTAREKRSRAEYPLGFSSNNYIAEGHDLSGSRKILPQPGHRARLRKFGRGRGYPRTRKQYDVTARPSDLLYLRRRQASPRPSRTVLNPRFRPARYCYDALNRLTTSATASSPGPATCSSTGAGITAKTIAYDQIGNITSKNDVGTYAYPSSGSARPHAISSITGTVNGVTNPSYTYDSNGNMLTGAGRTVTYTAFNMAASIVQGTTADCLAYDSDHARIKMEVRASTCGGTLSATTYYLNDPISGAMSEKLVAGGTTTWHDYVRAGGGLVAERSCTGATPCTSGATWSFFVLDHLGSSSVLTNAAGTMTEQLSYDAWGRRRNLNGTDNSACSITSATSRGYTGHEMLDSICEINANARIYDPTIGRFMSADSTVPDGSDGQSFNRYSYVNNGPMSATDPSGHTKRGIEVVVVTADNPQENKLHDNFRPSIYDIVFIDPDIGFGSDGGSGGGAGTGSDDSATCQSNSGDNGQTEVACVTAHPEPAQPHEASLSSFGGRDNGRCLSNVGDFVNLHLPDAQTLASELGNDVSDAEVLATAGNETGYGGAFARFGNYFGLHGDGPAGTYYTVDNNTPVQKFSGPDTFMTSGQVFVSNIRPYLSPGMGANPLAFFKILNKHGYATGNSGYPAAMVRQGQTRGAYTLVSACLAG
jgi:RHS repeat-associated protein